MDHCQVAVVGSGFAGTILARVLHRLGLKVILIERDRHPRFAVGESSTPLAAICLERLARTFEMPDLLGLAAYGRWLEQMPDVRRGLKRGFTFYQHRPGVEQRDSPANENRLLVAASPDDVVADSHWLREDVDHHLVRMAVAEGVDYRDQTDIRSLRRTDDDGWHLSGLTRSQSFELTTDFLLDGSGAGGFLARSLGIPSALEEVELDTSLVYGHFHHLGPSPELSPGPYPDERAAVHHLLEEGWMYVLPFDHGVVSAGILFRREVEKQLTAAGFLEADAIWHQVIQRYPTLAKQFGPANPIHPLNLMPRVQRRLATAAGDGWAALPHTYSFLDPMFSIGIAWSLVAVERLASIFAAGSEQGRLDPPTVNAGLDRYGRLLAAEAKQAGALLEGAYSAIGDFELFTAQALLYFAFVSYEEVYQRLFPAGKGGVPTAWRGFLGAGDRQMEQLFRESKRRLAAMSAAGKGSLAAIDRKTFADWITESIALRNIAGFGDPKRRNLYPVDLELLIERADLMGLTGTEMRIQIPRLRGLDVGP